MARGVGHRTSQTIQLRHDQDVTAAARGQCLAQAWPGAVRAGEPVVDVDPFGSDPERGEGLALGGQVLGVGGAPRIPDLELGHRGSVPVVPPSPILFTEPGLRDTRPWADISSLVKPWVSR